MKKTILLLFMAVLFSGPLSAQTDSVPRTQQETNTSADKTLPVVDSSAIADILAAETPQAVHEVSAAENPYKSILQDRQFVFSIRSILRGLLGLVSILLIA
ncbi:MAG TPA: hypothetical protein PK603_01550, partial [Bacteroidales bacterium]|nr:hypothetical protein [Bacteroidales bacterium]